MAIGRTFEESLQKALRMTHPSTLGFSSTLPAGKTYSDDFDMEGNLTKPNNIRIHTLARVGDLIICLKAKSLYNLISLLPLMLHSYIYMKGFCPSLQIINHQSF